jgi:hypothetical protein
LTDRVGLIPDEVNLMASRHPGPKLVPRTHLWKLASGLPGTKALDEHFAALLAKLEGSAPRVRHLLDGGEASGCISVARYFEPGPEDREIIEPGQRGPGWERLRGQHPLVGFQILPALISYVADAGLWFDFDEYGDEDE